MAETLLLPRSVGHVFKLAENDQSRLLNSFVEAEVDPDAMRASAVICTAATDDDDESIVPEGIDLESRYRLNPTVLWEHGMHPAIPFPIARSETADGQLTVSVANGVMTADSFFTNKVRESEQIFALIEEKIVRGTSVRVDPDYSKVVKKGLVTVYPVSSLIEWSWLALGCNPEAVAKALGRGTLAGSSICEPLLKTLKPLLPKRMNLWSPGENTMATDKTKALPCDDKTKAIDPAAPPPAAPPPAAPDTASEPALEEPSTDSPSGQVLSAIHSSIAGLLANIAAAANTYENPDAMSFVNDTLVPALTDLASQVDAAYSACSAGKSMTPADGEDMPADEEVMKSWLSSNRSRGFQLDGYSARLKLLGTAKNLTPDQRLTVTGIVKHISGLTQKARESAKPTKPAEPTVSPELLKKLDDTSTLFKSLAADLKATVPPAPAA